MVETEIHERLEADDRVAAPTASDPVGLVVEVGDDLDAACRGVLTAVSSDVKDVLLHVICVQPDVLASVDVIRPAGVIDPIAHWKAGVIEADIGV